MRLPWHQEGHPHVSGAQCGHFQLSHLIEGAGGYKGDLIFQLLRHLPGGDIIGEQVVDFFSLLGQLEDGGGEVVPVAVAGENV